MKRTELIIISIFTFGFFLFTLSISSVLTVANYKISLSFPTKDGFALIGACVAFYNVFWNLYKYIKENVVKKTLSISTTPRFNDSEIELECSFENNSEYPMKIDFCFSKGIAFNFDSIELKEKETLTRKVQGKRIDGIKINKNIFGKSNINFQYRYLNELSKYKSKSIKTDLRCIE